MSSQLYFYKGKTDCVEDVSQLESLYDLAKGNPQDLRLFYIKSEFRKVLQVNNLSFFLGAGCSSHKVDGKELGVSSIAPLTKIVLEALDDEEKAFLKDTVKIDTENSLFNSNIEKVMEVLENYRLYLEKTMQDIDSVMNIITKVKKTIYSECKKSSPEVLSIYESFYRKLMFRNSTLQRPVIITPNYDLFNERSAEKLGVEYCNGFSGYHDRRFNPGVFNHVYAEKLGIGSKVTTIDNFVYLLKLHGSISWFREDESLYGVSERAISSKAKDNELKEMMIYPTPAKQSASMSSPYSDLIRQFQKTISEKENILVSVGYSFSDEHINNVIFQALSSSKFRLVIFSSIKDQIKKLVALDDPRIWVIGGEYNDGNIHYFKPFIDLILEADVDHQKEEKIKDNLKQLLV